MHTDPSFASAQAPQNRIQIGSLPKPGHPIHLTMDEKKLTLENLGEEGLQCQLSIQGEAPKIIPIHAGVTLIWQDGADNRIECLLHDDGRMEFLSFKPVSQNTSFVAASAGVHGQSGANPFATRSFPFGNGFPFSKRK